MLRTSEKVLGCREELVVAIERVLSFQEECRVEGLCRSELTCNLLQDSDLNSKNVETQ